MVYLDEFEHKKHLYLKYRNKFGEEEIAKRLGLKKFEHEHFKKIFRNVWEEPISSESS